MTLFLTGLIILFELLLHFFKLGSIPFFSNSFPTGALIQSASFNIISSFLIYAIAKILFRKNRTSLISFFIFSSLPWVVETSRGGIYLNFLLFWILVLILLLAFIKKIIHFSFVLTVLRPVLFLAGISAVVFFLKKPEWIFSPVLYPYTLEAVLSHSSHLVSPSFLFFSNDSFWYGGNKEAGILLLSFLPFLFLGITETFRKDLPVISVWLTAGILLSVFNPYFPESFEFYIAVPVFVFSIAGGFYIFRSVNRLIIALLVLLFVFEYSLYLHTYFIHYSQNTRSYFQNLKKPL